MVQRAGGPQFQGEILLFRFLEEIEKRGEQDFIPAVTISFFGAIVAFEDSKVSSVENEHRDWNRVEEKAAVLIRDIQSRHELVSKPVGAHHPHP
jgi:hypothetical protein